MTVSFCSGHSFSIVTRTQVEALKAKGNVFYTQREYASALEQYNKAIDLHSGNHANSSSLPILYCNVAAVKIQMKDWVGARHSADDAIRAKGDYAKVRPGACRWPGIGKEHCADELHKLLLFRPRDRLLGMDRNGFERKDIPLQVSIVVQMLWPVQYMCYRYVQH
jgi:tetratricopeptide (TPR) repeat protein